MNLAATYPNAAVWQLSQTYGDIFAFGFGPLRFHWLVGEEALRFALQEAAPDLTLKGAYRFLAPIGGETALITSDEPEHLRRRRLVQPPFHGERLAASLATVAARHREFLRAQPGRFDLYGQVRPHVLALICELLLGRDALARHPAIVGHVGQMMAFANRPFLAQLLKWPLPGLPWRGFVRARAKLDALLYGLINELRASPAQGNDLLSLLLAEHSESGEGLSDLELRDQAVSLVSAGFETTSASIAWGMYLLLEHPPILAALCDELRALTTPEAILRAPLLDAAVKETLRLYPAAPAGLRQASRALSFQGFDIPAGSLLAYSIYVTQRQERAFENALAFDPARWLTGAAPRPFTYLPFGYGARYCIGAQLATAVIKLFLHALLTEYDVKPAWSGEVRETGNTVHPSGGLPIRLAPRSAFAPSAPGAGA